MTYIRIRYEKVGGHFHCRVFTSQVADGTYANCGSLVFDEREFPDIRAELSGCDWKRDEAKPLPRDTTGRGQ